MINLLPPARLTNLKIARSNTIIRRYVELTLLSMAFLAVAVIVAYYFLNAQQVDTKQTVEVDQKKIAELQPVQKQAEQLSLTVNTVAGLLSHNIKFSDMLTQIGGVMPQGSVLTGLQFSIEDLKSPLIISAQVDSEQKAAILRNNIASSPLFSKADIQTISQVGATGSTNSTPSNDGAPTDEAKNDSIYKFTTVINAYFKDSVVKK